jgi:hypothetical protein
LNTMIAIIMLTKGINIKNIHHAGRFVISNKTKRLYIGIITAQPCLPAFR